MKSHKKLLLLAVSVLILLLLGAYYAIRGPKDEKGFTDKHKPEAAQGITYAKSISSKIKLDTKKAHDNTYDYGCDVQPANQTPGYSVGCFVEQVVLYEGTGSRVADLEKIAKVVYDSDEVAELKYTVPPHEFAEQFVNGNGVDSVGLKSSHIDSASLNFALLGKDDYAPEGQDLKSYHNLHLRDGKGQGESAGSSYLFGYSILVRYASDSCWIGCKPSNPYH